MQNASPQLYKILILYSCGVILVNPRLDCAKAQSSHPTTKDFLKSLRPKDRQAFQKITKLIFCAAQPSRLHSPPTFQKTENHSKQKAPPFLLVRSPQNCTLFPCFVQLCRAAYPLLSKKLQ